MIFTPKQFLVGLFFSFFAFIYVAQAQPVDAVIEQFTPYVEETLKEWNIPGAAVAIVYRDKIVFLKTYGVRNLTNKEPVDAHTVFRLGSVSKAFAAELTGIMVERGKINWDDPLVKYLPDIKLHDDDITKNLTIRYILSQRTGLPAHSLDNLIENNQPYSDVILSLNKIPAICQSGECYAYQNVTYSLSGEILRSITNQTYPELVKQYIFQPLQMNDASATYEALMANPNHADCTQLTASGNFSTCSIGKYYYNVAPAAGINASISDMATWLRAQMGAYPRVISPNIVKTVVTPQIESTDELKKPWAPWQHDRIRSAYYGLGWRIFDYSGTSLIYHGGFLRGINSGIAFIPQDQIGIVVLTNAGEPIPGLLIARFYDLYLNLPLKNWSTALLTSQKQALKPPAKKKKGKKTKKKNNS